jgi:hypothetical protein
MNRLVAALCLLVFMLVSGCSAETAKRTTYETLQNVKQQECLKDPSATDCGKKDSYEDYERQRKALEKPPD